MLRRQALGTLTVNNNSNNNLNGLNNKINVNLKGGLTSATTITTVATIFKSNSVSSTTTTNTSNHTLLNQMQFNDENEPPQFVLSTLAEQATNNNANTQHAKKCGDEFEIFQEEQMFAKNSANHKKPGSNENKIVIGSSNSNKENLLFKSEEDEEEDEDEDEEEEEESDDDDDEDDDDEEDNSEQCNDGELEEEEEGISRLNLAAIAEVDIGAAANTSNLELMMDSTTSTNFTASPMVLDDTIKFISKLEGDEKDAENYNFFDDEEEDEEAKKKLDAENILLNMIDYKEDILKYMKKLEQELRPKVSYMKKQMDITSSMRSILVDWLVEVAEEYKLNIETLYLAVNYTDRFLSQMSVLRSKLQLVGTASMYIASKYEEITPPDVNEFVYITDDTYTKKQVLRMEHLLLKVLDFRVSQPTANWFLTNYLKFIKLNTSLNNTNNSDLFQRIECLARYLAELTLLDVDTFLNYMPSQIAASAIYLALHTLNKPWTKQIADILDYNHDLSELKPCIVDMFKFYQQAAAYPQQAIQEKYKQSKYEHVSLIDPPKTLPFLVNSTVLNSA